MKKDHTEELQGDSGNMFYQVLALDGEDTPDVFRKDLHEALDVLLYMFRDSPTLPADPCNPACALPGARANDVALLCHRSILLSRVVHGVEEIQCRWRSILCRSMTQI